MPKKEKYLLRASIALAAVFAVAPASNAMHIMEGYLPAGYCVAWGLVCLPFLIAGFFSLKNKVKENRRNLTLIAMSGAFIFVISSLKIPSVTGSCSHMTGTGLGAVLFGPASVSVLGIIVLIFQAVLLAHGGLTTLGANTFSMAIAGPLVSFGIYRLCQKIRINRRVGIFLAAFPGDLFTYCVTSIQLALAYPSEAGGVGASVVKFLGVFAPTQLPLAVIEGILTVVIVIGLETYAKPELKSIGFFKRGRRGKMSKNTKTVLILLAAAILIAVVPLFALKGAKFGGSDNAGSEMAAEINGEYEPWFTPVLETALGGELPGEVESLIFCVQTGIGVGVIAFFMGRFVERKKWMKEEPDSTPQNTAGSTCGEGGGTAV